MLPPPPAGGPEGKTLCGGTCIDGCCTSEGTPGQLCGEACIGADACCKIIEDVPTVWAMCGELCIDPNTQVREAVLPRAALPQAVHPNSMACCWFDAAV